MNWPASSSASRSQAIVIGNGDGSGRNVAGYCDSQSVHGDGQSVDVCKGDGATGGIRSGCDCCAWADGINDDRRGWIAVIADVGCGRQATRMGWNCYGRTVSAQGSSMAVWIWETNGRKRVVNGLDQGDCGRDKDGLSGS